MCVWPALDCLWIIRAAYVALHICTSHRVTHITQCYVFPFKRSEIRRAALQEPWYMHLAMCLLRCIYINMMIRVTLNIFFPFPKFDTMQLLQEFLTMSLCHVQCLLHCSMSRCLVNLIFSETHFRSGRHLKWNTWTSIGKWAVFSGFINMSSQKIYTCVWQFVWVRRHLVVLLLVNLIWSRFWSITFDIFLAHTLWVGIRGRNII